MRLVRFEDPSGALALDLHPLLTVISGLPPHARDRLVAAVSALPRGDEPGGQGTIEVHGVYLELSRPSLELLEMHQELDVVLRAADLPGAETRAQTGATPNVGEHESTSDGDAARERDQVVQELGERRRDAEALVATLDADRERLREASAARASIDHRLGAAKDALDPFAAASAKVARDELDAIVRRSEMVAASSSRSDEHAGRQVELRSLLASRRELRRAVHADIERLGALDPDPVRHALDQLQRAGQSVQVPSADAERLLHEWRSYAAQRSAFESRRAGSRNLLAEVSAKRDRAYDEFVEAERALRSPQLDTKLVDELEMVHDELFEIDGRTGKIGGAKLRRRQEELRVHESKLLAQLGFDTWSAYVMGVSAGGADIQRSHRFQVAQAAYQLAEDELARVGAGSVQDEGEVRDLAEREAGLRRRIAALVGRDPGSDPEAALRSARQEVPATGDIDQSRLALELRRRLSEMGASLPPGDVSVAELEAVAGGWLDAMGELPARLAQLRQQLLDIDRDLADREAELVELETGPPPGGTDVSAVDLQIARERLADAERRLAAHEEASARLASMQQELEVLARQEESTRGQIAEAEQRVQANDEAIRLVQQRLAAVDDGARRQAERESWAAASLAEGPDVSRSAADAEAIEWYVLARLAQQRSVSFVGSVPIVVDDAFVGWSVDDLREVITRLERMSEVIQIVYLTDDPGIVAWSRGLGTERSSELELATTY